MVFKFGVRLDSPNLFDSTVVAHMDHWYGIYFKIVKECVTFTSSKKLHVPNRLDINNDLSKCKYLNIIG